MTINEIYFAVSRVVFILALLFLAFSHLRPLTTSQPDKTTEIEIRLLGMSVRLATAIPYLIVLVLAVFVFIATHH